ncbi:MAG: glycosyltransferase family 2 protein [Myxococcales bacterium]|nr:glycosyltransferase family 2 protein [Myxococcales bacterium]
MEPRFSVVVPVYNEADNLDTLHARLGQVMAGLGGDYELLFVDDGSQDGSAERLQALHGKDRHVRVLRLSRNFGHHLAITAGLDRCRGQRVVLMDADLQDAPEAIPVLNAKLEDGFDMVYAERDRSADGAFKRWTSRALTAVLRALLRDGGTLSTSLFRIMTRQVVDEVCRCREHTRFVNNVFAWVGFRQTSVPVSRAARHGGRSKYGLLRMLKLAWMGLAGSSNLPLQLATIAGCAVSVLAVLVAGASLLGAGDAEGSRVAQLEPAILLFVAGVQLLCLGMVGGYVGRVFTESRARPLYIVAQHLDTPEREGDDAREA